MSFEDKHEVCQATLASVDLCVTERQCH